LVDALGGDLVLVVRGI